MKTTETINYGDKIYARLSIGGRDVVEFMVEWIGNMSELLAELRQQARLYHGLAQLYVRNFTQGWSRKQPLMLYTPARSEARRAQDVRIVASQRQMLFPWETH